MGEITTQGVEAQGWGLVGAGWRPGGLFGCGDGVLIVLSGFGSAMEGPGLSFRGREASLVQPRVPVVTWQTSEGFSPEGISTTSFSLWLDPLGGVGNTFSRCRRWVYGNLRRERRGRCFQGPNGPRVLARHMRGTFGQRSRARDLPHNIVDLPSPGWMGKGHETRGEGITSLACVSGLREGRWDEPGR